MIVGIQGVQSVPALNGTVGVVRGYDRAPQRYKIQIEDGAVKKFKRCNLVLEEELDSDYDLLGEEQNEMMINSSSGLAGLEKSYVGSSAALSRHGVGFASVLS